MRLALGMLCLSAVSFMLRVLIAFMKDFRAGTVHRGAVYVSATRPKRKQEPLLALQIDPYNGKLPRKLGKGVLLMCLLSSGLALPMHSQSSEQHSPDSVAKPGSQQVPQEVLQELDAMKKRIEQLEAQLKGQRAADSTSPDVVSSAPSSTSDSSSTSPTASGAITDATRIKQRSRNRRSHLRSQIGVG